MVLLAATIAGVASMSMAASASFVWLQNSQNLLEFEDGKADKLNNDESLEVTERDESSEGERSEGGGSSISTQSSQSSSHLQMHSDLSSSMTIYDLESPLAAHRRRSEQNSRQNSSQISQVDIPFAYEQKAAQEKAARLQRLLAMAADTEKDEQNERILQEMRDAQDARFKAQQEAKLAEAKAEEQAKLAQAKAEEQARLEALQEKQRHEQEDRKSRIQEARLRKSQKEAELAKQIRISQQEEIRRKELEEAKKREAFVLAMKLIKVKTVTGPLAVKMSLAKTSPFFEIDRINTTKVDKKGRPITEFVFRSDYIVDDDSPQWQPVMLDAEYLCNNNRNHPIVIRVKDYDESGNHVYIGEFQTTFNELINSVTTADDEDSAKVIKLKKDGKTSGKIVVTSARVEKIVPTKKAVSGWLKLNLKGERFKNFDGVLSKSDPFFEVSRIDKGTGKPILVYRSPYVKSNLWPDWKESRIRMDKLFADGMDQVIHFDVYDHDKKGSHEFMGGFETTMEGLVKSSETDVPFEMLSRKGKPKGTIFVEMVEVVDQQDESQFN